MSKSDGTVVQIGMKDIRLSEIDWAKLNFDPGPIELKTHETSLPPIVIEGTWDHGALTFSGPVPRELTIVNGRRFLRWTVAHQRIRQGVRLQPPEINQAPDGVTVSIPMQCEGPSVVIPSPWWERALFAIARIWS